MNSKKNRVLYVISIILLVLFATTFLIMPVSNYVTGIYEKVIPIIVGSVFWLSGIGGYAILIYLYSADRKQNPKKKRMRFYFLSNVLSAVADICFIVGSILLIVFVCIDIPTLYAIYVDLFVIVLGFNAHWLFSRNLHSKILKKNKNRRKA